MSWTAECVCVVTGRRGRDCVFTADGRGDDFVEAFSVMAAIIIGKCEEFQVQRGLDLTTLRIEALEVRQWDCLTN